MALQATVAVPRTRFVIVHYHIFKNGGSTIESILRREFGSAFATLHGDNDDSILDARDLSRFIRSNRHITAISSHHLRYPKPAARRMVIFDCCFLRHPLERLDSLYTYFRKIDSTDPIARHARRVSQREFMTEMLRECPHIVSEVQVTQLANGGAFVRPANERDLDRATRIIRDVSLLGLVEMFNESLVSAEYFLKGAFPKLSLDEAPRNVSRPVTYQRSVRSREERLIDLWGPEVYGDLTKLNRLDLELFLRVENEVRRRFLLVPGFEGKLAEFRERCSRRAYLAMEREETVPLATAKAAG
jgi:hypothetical protein